MKRNKRPRALAIGMDAAEPSLVRRLIEEDQLPSLKHLLERGAWMPVESPAEIGSGAVWPTFVTGMGAREHGIYGEWCWQPETMGLARFSGRSLKPFWETFLGKNISVGIFDVPFAPALDLSSGFQVSEWGAHDTIEGRMEISPASLSSLIEKTKPHPFRLSQIDASGPDDVEGLSRVFAACLEGVRLRGELATRLILKTQPELSVITFTEIHRASHQLWHTVAPCHPFYAHNGSAKPSHSNFDLRNIYREVDTQIGKLLEVAGEDACIFVFALHGMRPAIGIPTFLDQLLVETGWAHLPDWAAQSWRERALSSFSALKQRSPASLKKLYYKTMPRKATYHLAQPTMMPAYDWSRTRAFSLPTDQHGWIRLNLCGRETKGVVQPRQYEEACRQLERMLLNLRTDEGRPLVSDVMMTSESYEAALKQRLPDLIVHYADAAFAPSLKISGMPFVSRPIGKKNTGQHATGGFLLASGRPDLLPQGDRICASDLCQLLIASLSFGM
ncbi:MAG: alkaline phosphatase family protein [Pyrinomonadaceae bacterium]